MARLIHPDKPLCKICGTQKSIRKYPFQVRHVAAGEPVCNRCCFDAIIQQDTHGRPAPSEKGANAN